MVIPLQKSNFVLCSLKSSTGTVGKHAWFLDMYQNIINEDEQYDNILLHSMFHKTISTNIHTHVALSHMKKESSSVFKLILGKYDLGRKMK